MIVFLDAEKDRVRLAVSEKATGLKKKGFMGKSTNTHTNPHTNQPISNDSKFVISQADCLDHFNSAVECYIALKKSSIILYYPQSEYKSLTHPPPFKNLRYIQLLHGMDKEKS